MTRLPACSKKLRRKRTLCRVHCQSQHTMFKNPGSFQNLKTLSSSRRPTLALFVHVVLFVVMLRKTAKFVAETVANPDISRRTVVPLRSNPIVLKGLVMMATLPLLIMGTHIKSRRTRCTAWRRLILSRFQYRLLFPMVLFLHQLLVIYPVVLIVIRNHFLKLRLMIRF